MDNLDVIKQILMSEAEYWLIAKKNYVMRYHELERIEDQIYFVSFPETIPRGLKYEEIKLKHVEQLYNTEIECNIMLSEPYVQPFQVGITLRDVWKAIPVEAEAREFLTAALNKPNGDIYYYESLYHQIIANKELPNTNLINNSNDENG